MEAVFARRQGAWGVRLAGEGAAALPKGWQGRVDVRKRNGSTISRKVMVVAHDVDTTWAELQSRA